MDAEEAHAVEVTSHIDQPVTIDIKSVVDSFCESLVQWLTPVRSTHHVNFD
jgi:hypothetical protein